MNKFLLALVTVAALAGCRSPYSWTSDVPQKLRTVAVPTFRNESDVTELGVLAATQILREFQREGTFKIARPDDAAVEVQGVITDVYVTSNGGDVRTGNRTTDCSLMMRAEVSVVEGGGEGGGGDTVRFDSWSCGLKRAWPTSLDPSFFPLTTWWGRWKPRRETHCRVGRLRAPAVSQREPQVYRT